MAHNLNYANGKYSMFYTGEKPWHGLGTELDHPATAKEAIELAGLDYEVKLIDVYACQNANSQLLPIPFKKASVRVDTGDVLGVVSPDYKIINNTEAFSFFDSVVGEGQAIYHTAGALGKGEKVWLLAKLPKDLIIKDDVVEQYLALMTGHNGNTALKLFYTPIRIVCQNTLVSAMASSKEGISIRHIGNIKSKIQEAQRALGIAVESSKEFEEVANRFASTQMSVSLVDEYFRNVLQIDEINAEDEISSRKQNQLNELNRLFEHGKGNDNSKIRHTVWAAYNAVTEYTDHIRTVKGLKEDKTNRLDSIWFGSGARFKARAYEEAVALVTN